MSPYDKPNNLTLFSEKLEHDSILTHVELSRSMAAILEMPQYVAYPSIRKMLFMLLLNSVQGLTVLTFCAQWMDLAALLYMVMMDLRWQAILKSQCNCDKLWCPDQVYECVNLTSYNELIRFEMKLPCIHQYHNGGGRRFNSSSRQQMSSTPPEKNSYNFPNPRNNLILSCFILFSNVNPLIFRFAHKIICCHNLI